MAPCQGPRTLHDSIHANHEWHLEPQTPDRPPVAVPVGSGEGQGQDGLLWGVFSIAST